MNETPQESKVIDAGEYVLGVMDDTQRSAFEARMAQDPALAQQVKEWTEHLAAMSTKLPQQPVNPAVWVGVSRALDTLLDKPAAQQGSSWAWLWKGWAVMASAASVVLAVQLGGAVKTSDQPRYIVVMKSPDLKTEWLVEARPNEKIRLYQIGQLPLEQSPSALGKSLQFWTKAPTDAGPTSLGLVELGKPLELPADVLPKLVDQQLFEVTLEPKDGSPLNRPTGPILFVGNAVAIN